MVVRSSTILSTVKSLARGPELSNRVNAVGAVLFAVVLFWAFLPWAPAARAQGGKERTSPTPLHATTPTHSTAHSTTESRTQEAAGRKCKTFCHSRECVDGRRNRRARGMGSAGGGRGEWRNSVSAQRGPILCAGIQYEVADHCAGAGEVGKRVPVSHHGRNARCDRRGWRVVRRCGVGGTRRSKSFQPQVSVYGERGIRWFAESACWKSWRMRWWRAE